MKTLRIATRKSALALWQADHVRELLLKRGHESALVPLSTLGDRITDRPLLEAGGKGLFVKELEEALIEGRADLAVHSAKDVPYALPPGLSLCAFPVREDPRDALVSPRFRTFAALPRRARVGTSSLRRGLQLLAARPDLRIVPLRGNVQTRLLRAAADLDAAVLALSGLRRLGLEEQVTEVLPLELSLPAAGQGALALEARAGSAAWSAAHALDDGRTARCVLAERALLQRLAGGCTVPIAAHAVEEGGVLRLRARIAGPHPRYGADVVHAERVGPPSSPDDLGFAVAAALIDAGGARLLEAARASAPGLAAPVA
jgi:hydroxymethylbilane synthase